MTTTQVHPKLMVQVERHCLVFGIKRKEFWTLAACARLGLDPGDYPPPKSPSPVAPKAKPTKGDLGECSTARCHFEAVQGGKCSAHAPRRKADLTRLLRGRPNHSVESEASRHGGS